MDKDIKDLKNLWQQQTVEPKNTQKMIDKLNAVEKKNKRDRLLVLAIFPATIIPLLFFIPILESPYYMASIIIIAIAMLMIIFLNFRNKFETVKDSQEVNNTEFINYQIGKLKDKKKLTSFYMWIYAVLIISGINIAYIEVFDFLFWPIRMLIHLTVTFMLFLFMATLVVRQKKKNEIEIEPLIQQLESMKE